MEQMGLLLLVVEQGRAVVERGEAICSRLCGGRGPDVWDVGHVAVFFAAASIEPSAAVLVLDHEKNLPRENKKRSEGRGQSGR